MMLSGIGTPHLVVEAEDVARQLTRAGEQLDLDGKRVLVIIPDGTRTAPIALFFRLLGMTSGQRTAVLDYLVALGTHPPMPAAAIDRLVGMSEVERAAQFPRTKIFNHAWDDPAQLTTIGVIPAVESETLTGGLLRVPFPSR